MRCSRFLAALTAAVLLVVYSGCGGDEKKEPNSTGPGGTNQAKAGDKAAASSSGGQTSSNDKAAIDLSLVTPEHFAAIVIRPRRIAQSPLVAELLKEETTAGAIKKFGIDPGEVEQVVVLLSLGDFGMDGKRLKTVPRPVPVIIARFTHDVDAKEVLTKLQAAEGLPGPHRIEDVKVGGKTCLDTGDAPMAYLPSKNTIVLAMKEDMGKTISVTEPSGPLWERLKKADADNDILVAVEPFTVAGLDKLVDMMKKGVPPQAATYLSAVNKLRGGTATFNLTAPSMLRLVLDAKDAEAAGDVDELLQQAVRMAGGGLMVAKQGMPKEAQAAFGPLVKLAEQLVDGAKTTKSGSQVTLDVKRPEILDTAGESIVSTVTQSTMEARAAARRARQANNMKQISSAMLLYESIMGTFPPAVFEKDGKPSLSWRVAILSFIGEEALYERFHPDEPWDSPHNLEAAKKMPSVFQSTDSPNDGKTRIMLFTGKGAAFDGSKRVRAADIRDGRSNTILFVEAGPDKAVPWTKPEDLPFDPNNPLAALGKVSPQGFRAGFFDGSVHLLKVDNKTLKALITPDGGEAIDREKVFGGR